MPRISPIGIYMTVIIGIVVAWFSACGLVEADYENYREGGASVDAGTDDSSADDPKCQEALAAFATNVLAVTDKSCSCHQTGAGGTLKFTTGDGAATRQAILAYTGADHQKLFNKISLQIGVHGGGDLSSTLTEEAVTAWADKEGECGT